MAWHLAPAPVEWASLQIRNGKDPDVVARQWVHDAIREAGDKLSANEAVHQRSGFRMLTDLIDCALHLVQERITQPWTLGVVVAGGVI
jgi:hypothetical protein